MTTDDARRVVWFRRGPERPVGGGGNTVFLRPTEMSAPPQPRQRVIPAGRYLRRAHHCPTPADARPGDVWQCYCGRRWLFWRNVLGGRTCRLRHLWPWLRSPKIPPLPEETLR